MSLFVDYAGWKFIATMAISFVIGIIVNKLSSYSGFIQGFIVASLCIFIMFIRLTKIRQFMSSSWYICKQRITGANDTSLNITRF